MKRIIAVFLMVLITVTLFAGCSGSGTAAESAPTTNNIEGSHADAGFYGAADLAILNGKKIGITVQSLQNAYWAGVMPALQAVLAEAGAECTVVSCDDNAAAQIGQIDQFISAGCDLIMVHPSDAAAIEGICADARNAGIRVMCWDDPMENTDANWILDNTALGKAIGEMAAEFINEHYTAENPAKVAVIGYPQTVILHEREDGIKAGLEEKAAGKYEIVAMQAGIVASEAKTAMETILQTNPDVKVVVGIGAGAMIGADEALNAAASGIIPEDMGVFTTDVTKQQLDHLLDAAYPAKGIIGFEGSDEDTAACCASMFALILAGKLDQQNVYRSTMRITETTAAQIIGGMK